MADIGTGASISFPTSGWTAQLTAINGVDITRSEHGTSHLGTTTGMTFIPGDLFDPGGLDLELHFDQDNTLTNVPPYNAAAETITVTFPTPSGGAGGATMAATGFMTAFSWTGPLEELMSASATIKFSGNITWADAT